MELKELMHMLDSIEYLVEQAKGERKYISQDFKDREDATELMKSIVADKRFATCVSHLTIDDLYHGEREMPELRFRLNMAINYNSRKY